MTVTEQKEVIYKDSKIIAWREQQDNKFQVHCHLYRVGSKWQPLNLRECNDGSPFTAVNQAINQAKQFIDICLEHNW